MLRSGTFPDVPRSVAVDLTKVVSAFPFTKRLSMSGNPTDPDQSMAERWRRSQLETAQNRAEETASPSRPADSDTPTRCPSCRSSDLVTTSKVVSADAYWRCCACGEVWNATRLRAASNKAAAAFAGDPWRPLFLTRGRSRPSRAKPRSNVGCARITHGKLRSGSAFSRRGRASRPSPICRRSMLRCAGAGSTASASRSMSSRFSSATHRDVRAASGARSIARTWRDSRRPDG